jgi:predicted PurR-regulated permease PerM
MSAQQVFRNTVVVILTVLTAYILFISLNIVVILLFAIIIASALRPIILWFDRHGLSQGLAILVTYVGLLALIIGIFVVALPPAINRLGGYIENDDRLAQKLIAANTWAENGLNNLTQPDKPITLLDDDSIRSTVSRTVANLKRTLPEVAGDVGGIIGEAILVFVIGVYWITSRDQAVEFTLQLFSMGKRGEVREIITEIEQGLGAYVRGMGMVVLFVGVANFLLLTLFHISPILVIVAIFVGFAVGGVIGGLVAVPIAGTLMVLARHLIIEPKKSEVTPQRVEGGILIAGKETRLDSALPSETGTVP